MSELAQLRLLLDSSSDVHWLIDCASGRLLYLSAAHAALGFSVEEAQRHADALLAQLPARLARFQEGDVSRLRLRRELALERADGSSLAVEIESTLVLDKKGQPVQLAGVVRDLSRQQAERAEWETQQKRFASMLSHEFRTPLSTIDGAVQRLEMTSANADEATRKRYRKIQVAVDRLIAMIDDYLSPERLASIGRKRQANEISPEALLETVGEAARVRRNAINVKVVGLPPWLRCDPQGMRLCLDVLLDNAIKYTAPDTAIELVGKKASEGGVEFAVIDHGPALPADEIAHLGERGFRGRAAEGIAGSGLGLYMARAVAEAHGGSLTVENLSESGKKFRIWLPIAV